MSQQSATLVKPPPGFRAYPANKDILDGTVDVPLGRWLINGKAEVVHLRIDARKIGNLAAWLNDKPHHEARMGQEAFNVYIVPGAEERAAIAIADEIDRRMQAEKTST